MSQQELINKLLEEQKPAEPDSVISCGISTIPVE